MKPDLTGSLEADDTPLVPGSTHEEWHPYSVWRDKIRREDNEVEDRSDTRPSPAGDFGPAPQT